MVRAPRGKIFGKDILQWRNETRSSLGISEDVPVIIAGHQPEFFHPGILAKFIAGDIVARDVGGELVHLVVDHCMGSLNPIEIPTMQGDQIEVIKFELSALVEQVIMKDQKRVVLPRDIEPFATALFNASGDNAAIQIGNATDALMSPWASVDHLIGSSELLQTEFGLRVIEEMRNDPSRCRESYNHAVSRHKNCGISLLLNDELPVWYGKHNANFGGLNDSIQPRALLLTLLARVSIGDLFVHGTGGMLYDTIMEQWAFDWLDIVPCKAVMATATLRMPLKEQTIEDARRQYFSPDGELEKKDQYIKSIDRAPYKSSERRKQFQAMHNWLSSLNTRPDEARYRIAHRIASRRDWSFPLYPYLMLDQLREVILEN
ncbi:MAG: hypothetical protein VX436_04085 [Planctomycetota bacterium]|nr:hypothetical protein [Planctomycetota bacterium]